jgi:hypothetical protein
MTGGQKTVTSIALGAGLVVAATAVTARMTRPADGGWFMYAPNSSVLVEPSGGSTLGIAAVWFGAIALWFVVSWRLFRSDT